jgi:glutamine synthetase
MSNELRNFLALSYDELEQLNLKAKEQRKNRVAAHKIQDERLEISDQELGQSHLRWLVDPRLYCTA